eukprot:scaffold199731_cov42-Prasinocladus_malaysianus.AAC.2
MSTLAEWPRDFSQSSPSAPLLALIYRSCTSVWSQCSAGGMAALELPATVLRVSKYNIEIRNILLCARMDVTIFEKVRAYKPFG